MRYDSFLDVGKPGLSGATDVTVRYDLFLSCLKSPLHYTLYIGVQTTDLGANR